MNYANAVRRHRRLAVLRHLADCAGYTSNASILVDALDGVGLRSSRDQVVTELAWLRENGFVSYEDTADFIVVEATTRGVEIAMGRATHPEIQRPGPRA